jgi:hypothetical protein
MTSASSGVWAMVNPSSFKWPSMTWESTKFFEQPREVKKRLFSWNFFGSKFMVTLLEDTEGKVMVLPRGLCKKITVI